jgi:oxygen-dependent protoporphyrinogen oxidase
MERLVVVGGGISGLAVAMRASGAAARAGRPLHVTVLEAESRPGGRMWSDRDAGFVVEWGPNGFLDSKPEALELSHDLGAGDLLLRASELAKKRFVVRDGRLVRLPESPPAFLRSRLLSWRGKVGVVTEPFAPAAPEGVDETLADFAARRLGPEARDYLIDPMVSGIFAGDPARLSLRSAFPRIHELERLYGGLFRGLLAVTRQRRREGRKSASGPAGPGGTLTSFRSGVRTLVETLAALLGPSLVAGARAQALRRTAAGWSVTATVGGEDRAFPADAVVLSCPAYEAARLLADERPSLAEPLLAIPYAPVAVVATAFRREDVPGGLDGFGYVVPGCESRPILGTLWDSAVFGDRAPPGHVLLRSMMGGARAPDLARRGDRETVDLVLCQLRDLMGIAASPERVWIFRHERGIPQYETGHADRLAAIEDGLARLPGVFACHNAYRGIALGDCAREAAATAERVAAYLFPDAL